MCSIKCIGAGRGAGADAGAVCSVQCAVCSVLLSFRSSNGISQIKMVS